MTTSVKTIRLWLERAKNNGSTFLIVACDMFEREDYPIYCSSKNEALLKITELRAEDLSGIHEVYDLNLDIEEQLSKKRVWSI